MHISFVCIRNPHALAYLIFKMKKTDFFLNIFFNVKPKTEYTHLKYGTQNMYNRALVYCLIKMPFKTSSSHFDPKFSSKSDD